MRFNNLIKIVMILIVITILFKEVNAIGVTPARNTVNFEANTKQSYTFTILNNENKEFNALIFIRGNLNNTIILPVSLVEFKSTDTQKTFTYELNFGNDLGEPGTHEGEIVIMELPPNIRQGGTFVGAVTSVILQIRVNVPYPGKYAKAELKVTESKANEYVSFLIPVYNLGVEDISNAKATIDIFGPTNEKIASIQSNELAIKSKDFRELTAKWTAKINPGKYYGVANVNYDGKIARAETVFGVGSLNIEILEVSVKDFRLGGVAKFDILLENRWNEEVKGIYAEMFVSNENGDDIANFKTATIDIDSLSKGTLNGFWDTAGVKEGTYNIRIVLHYQDKSSEKLLKAFVTLNAIRTQFGGITAEAVGGVGIGKESILTFVLVVLVGINIAWFVYFKRREKKKVQS